MAHHRTTPDLPENADIVVVGAGYSSAAFVTHLLSDLALVNAPSIVVLESRQLCFGATGRNGEWQTRAQLQSRIVIAKIREMSRWSSQARQLLRHSKIGEEIRRGSGGGIGGV